MGCNITGIALNKHIKLPEEIIHFYKPGGMLIFLEQDFLDIMRFISICHAGLLEKIDFSKDNYLSKLIPFLRDQTFVVFHYSEFARIPVELYQIVFIDGKFSKSFESEDAGLKELGLSFSFLDDEYYYSFNRAKRLYSENNTIK